MSLKPKKAPIRRRSRRIQKKIDKRLGAASFFDYSLMALHNALFTIAQGHNEVNEHIRALNNEILRIVREAANDQ